MSDVRTPPLPDPRPVLVDGTSVEGSRCTGCGLAVAVRRPRCPACGGALADASFGPSGTVWSATYLHVSVDGRPVPHGLAYVDLDDGPRVLATVADAPGRLTAGERVRLVGATPHGDLLVEPAEATFGHETAHGAVRRPKVGRGAS